MEDEELKNNLSERFVKIILNEKLSFEEKMKKIDWLMRLGGRCQL